MLALYKSQKKEFDHFLLAGLLKLSDCRERMHFKNFKHFFLLLNGKIKLSQVQKYTFLFYLYNQNFYFSSIFGNFDPKDEKNVSLQMLLNAFSIRLNSSYAKISYFGLPFPANLQI
jgi:hypothetical protein